MECYIKYNTNVNHNYISSFINGNGFVRNSSLETDILKSDSLNYSLINIHVAIQSIFQLPKNFIPKPQKM